MRARATMAAVCAVAVAMFAMAPAAADTALRWCGETTDATIVLEWKRHVTDSTLSTTERAEACDRLMKAATELRRPVSEVRVSAISSSTPAPAVAVALYADGKWTPE